MDDLTEHQNPDIVRLEHKMESSFNKLSPEEQLICKEAFQQAKESVREAVAYASKEKLHNFAKPLSKEEMAKQEKASWVLREEEDIFHKNWKGGLNEVSPRSKDSFPSNEKLSQIIKGWFEKTTLYSEVNKDDAKKIKDEVENGFNSTLDILKNEGFSWSKLFGYLSSISSGAKAVYSAYEFISKFGQPSEFQQLKQELQKINFSIQQVQNSINAGFANLIEHQTLSDFRKEVEVPTQILFDDYLRCYTILHKEPIEKLKMMWERNPPTSTASTLYTFVTTKRNIFSTMQEANKFLFSTNKEVIDILQNNAVRLITVNLFYYNILIEEAEGKQKEEAKELAKGELETMMMHLQRLNNRFLEIDAERLKQFHKNNVGHKLLKETFNQVKPAYPGNEKMFPPEVLPRLAEDMKKRWIDVNGPTDFYLMVFRGRHSTFDDQFVQRNAIWHVGDEERITVAEKVGFVANGKDQYSFDAICVALIQPITPEIVAAHKKVVKKKKRFIDLFNKLLMWDHQFVDHPVTFFKNVYKILGEPLFALHNIDKEDHLSQSGWDRVEQAPRMVGDACTLPGLEVLRFSQHGYSEEGFPFNEPPTENSVPLHRLIQYILQ